MEFPNLGKQCSSEHCKQLDFIPLQCQCDQYFCKHHFTQHSVSRQCDYFKNLENKPPTSTSPLFTCAMNKCQSSSYIFMPCVKCNKHYCLDHRFHLECYETDAETKKNEKEKWDKPREEFQKAKFLVDIEVTSNLRELQKSSNYSQTALKVQLMRLKSKAKGEKNIPSDDRAYFAVIKPINSNPKALSYECVESNQSKKTSVNLDNAVYVSKQWSIGRVIDSIANTLSIKNYNDKANEPKLRIFREIDKLCVGVNAMDCKLQEVLEKELLVSGETIMMDYIDLNVLCFSDKTAIFMQ